MDPTTSKFDFPHQVPAEFLACARSICPQNPVICDIGSRDALEAIFLCQILKAAECHIFEPNPPAAQACEGNIARFGGGCNILLNRLALSDKVGEVEFFPINPEKSENKDLGFSSLFPVNPAYASTRRGTIAQDRIIVPATTLDAYFEGRERGPDLLWIDVEGAERLVLSGGEKTLERVRIVHLEVSFRPMQVGKPLFWEIDEFLRSRRFRLLAFPGISRLKAFLVVHRILPNLPWRWNAVYCRNG